MRRMRRYTLLAVSALLAVTAFVAAQTMPLTITKAETKDLAGVSKTTFKRGEVIIVETTITITPAYYAPAPISYLQLITLWHRDTMMGLALTRDTISPGVTKVFGGGMLVRVGDPIGTYGIEVYVWNGFPSEMGAAWRPLATPAVRTVTVTP